MQTNNPKQRDRSRTSRAKAATLARKDERQAKRFRLTLALNAPHAA